ncbi:MAG: YwgA family protein [Bacillus sp. (in: firmicutes)]
MFKDHARIIQAIATVGEVAGRKRLQKMIYIAKKISFPFQEKYQFHFYGPYSEELTFRVEELCEMGYLHETKEKKNGYMQYCYSVSEDGLKFLENYKETIPNLGNCLKDMNGHNARFLELVSTVLYFEAAPKAEVAEKIFTLKSKQKYTMEEIEEAYRYIGELRKTAVRGQ